MHESSVDVVKKQMLLRDASSETMVSVSYKAKLFSDLACYAKASTLIPFVRCF